MIYLEKKASPFKSCWGTEPSAFWLLSLPSRCFYYTPAPLSCRLSRSTGKSLFHSFLFFSLLSLIKLLSSLALSAKCTLCGRDRVCMHTQHIFRKGHGLDQSHYTPRHRSVSVIGCIHTRCPAAPEITSGWILHRGMSVPLTYWQSVCTAGSGSILSYRPIKSKGFEYLIQFRFSIQQF